jgi:hypothetical protein
MKVFMTELADLMEQHGVEIGVEEWTAHHGSTVEAITFTDQQGSEFRAPGTMTDAMDIRVELKVDEIKDKERNQN